MIPEPETTPDHRSDLLDVLERVWGYSRFLPSQGEAVESIVSGRDTVVILPTGGGKSLTYQLPALVLGRTALVVSPLLALMKDQVDALTRFGVPAAALNSTLSQIERRDVMQRLRAGQLRLLYVSPEGLASDTLVGELAASGAISFIAVDEAHCISQWGHEYRPDYRQLGRLRELLPGVPIHAFTATATPAVRTDIARSLGLESPNVIVGSFERLNLTYRTVYRKDTIRQLTEVIDRHTGEAGIVYAISRKNVEELCKNLVAQGVRALPYHAGFDAETRRTHQERFSSEDVDVIVATVAFGMGIDRSNVRFVAHAGMPRSVEGYQQEAGRAGRDGLPAECVLLYSAEDLMTWRRIIGAPTDDHERRAAEKLNEIYRFARTLGCRHRFLIEYFGERWLREGCGACDVCLGEHAVHPDSVTLAQKILSGVARLHERFGAHYVVEMLRGGRTERILRNQHEQLSTWGLLKDVSQADLLDWVDQLVMLGGLERCGEHQTLAIGPEGRRMLRGEGEVRLALPLVRGERKSKGEREKARTELDGPGAGLFDALRVWRRATAAAEGVPPFVVFSDATLLAVAAERPGSLSSLRRCKGIGATKLERYGEAVLGVLRDHGVPTEPESPEPVLALAEPGPKAPAVPTPQHLLARHLFETGASLDVVAIRIGRAPSTVEGYWTEWIAGRGASALDPWVDAATCARIEAAASGSEGRLRPIFDALGGEVPYWAIRGALSAIHGPSGR